MGSILKLSLASVSRATEDIQNSCKNHGKIPMKEINLQTDLILHFLLTTSI